MPLPPAQFKYGAELGAPGDEYNKFPCREGSLRLLKDISQLPFLYRDLLYSSPVSGRHFSRSTYKFYRAWWPRVASWRCVSGFVVWRNSCSRSLACLFSD